MSRPPMIVSPRTSFLFAMPSFLEGMSRCLDIFGVYDNYNYCRTPEEADFVAIRNDWAAIGDDMRAVMPHGQAQ